jgi:hypothetical protein
VRQFIVYTSLLGLATYILVLLGTGWRVGDTLYRDMPVGNALYQLDTMGKRQCQLSNTGLSKQCVI